MAGVLHREINGIVDKKDGTKIYTLTADPEIYEDCALDLDDVEREFNPYPGDRIRLFIASTVPSKAIKIEPWEPLRTHTGNITFLTQSFGIVDKEIVFFIENDQLDSELSKGVKVLCSVIEGDYSIGRDKYEMRCESIKKFKDDSDEMKQWFNDDTDATPLEIENTDSDAEQPADEQNMEFESQKKKQPNEEYYDLPCDLYHILDTRNRHRIARKLAEFVPAELNYNTYKKRFHALIYLEECEMKMSFEKYQSSEIWIEPERTRFSVMCSKITELRPPIAVGDKIEVIRNVGPYRVYRGVVERVLFDRFILKFKNDFVEHFKVGFTYRAQFTHNRVIFQRKHAAVEYVKQKLDESFLFPKRLQLAENLQFDAKLNDNKLILNGVEKPWFRELNEEQQKAVVGALRAECRPYPYIVFGPPGTGKTSTLIEIILQVYTHVKDCNILIATQSNHAANVVATRLIACMPEIGNSMLRLVSNSVLDRKNLPKELHKFSASVLHANATAMIDDDYNVYADDIGKDVKRNCQLAYLKGFKLIVGTCVGLGILFNSEFSNGYFTHVIIDEAAQCSECEAMIPITCMKIKNGQVIMAGDPLQLPPISLSDHARHRGMVMSMLERYIAMYRAMEGVEPTQENGYDPRLVATLRRNYRALPSILKYYNNQFYNSTLVATICSEKSNEAIQLQTLKSILPPRTTVNEDDNPFGICFINVDGRNERMANKKSWENREEAALIKLFVSKLLEKKVPQDQVGVITPYHAQVLSLRKNLKHMKRIRVGTVEEFQGEEKMVIVISAVKTSGMERALQFIYCSKRLNTAISRARMLVVVFGKVSLLEGDENWAKLIEYCKENEAFMEGREFIQML